jgi:hypothetical protein
MPLYWLLPRRLQRRNHFALKTGERESGSRSGSRRSVASGSHQIFSVSGGSAVGRFGSFFAAKMMKHSTSNNKKNSRNKGVPVNRPPVYLLGGLARPKICQQGWHSMTRPVTGVLLSMHNRKIKRIETREVTGAFYWLGLISHLLKKYLIFSTY